eukprot:6327721-Pyramimonas_sp.AAC.1
MLKQILKRTLGRRLPGGGAHVRGVQNKLQHSRTLRGYVYAGHVGIFSSNWIGTELEKRSRRTKHVLRAFCTEKDAPLSPPVGRPEDEVAEGIWRYAAAGPALGKPLGKVGARAKKDS